MAGCAAFWRPGLLRKTENLGHRLGGDVVEDFPENTLEAFRQAIETLELKPNYLYTECDLRETKDHHIVLFHDWELSRLVPDNEANRLALGVPVIDETVLLKDFTLAEIQSLELKGGSRIPSLNEFFECVREVGPEKPILLELKFFHDQASCSNLIEVTKQFRDETGLEIHFLSFIRNLKRCHSNPKAWLAEFEAAGFRVYQVYRPKTAEHDLCKTW